MFGVNQILAIFWVLRLAARRAVYSAISHKDISYNQKLLHIYVNCPLCADIKIQILHS